MTSTSDGSDTINGIQPVPGDPSKVRVLFERADSVDLHIRTWAELSLKVGLEVSAILLERLQETARIELAGDQVARYLRFKPRTRHEVNAYLGRKGHSDELIGQLIQDFAERGLIDDDEYARAYVLQRERRHSRKEIAVQLQRRGIRLTGDVDSEARASTEAMEYMAASTAVQKVVRQNAGADMQTLRRKVAAHLQRRGFRASVIRRALLTIVSDADDWVADEDDVDVTMDDDD